SRAQLRVVPGQSVRALTVPEPVSTALQPALHPELPWLSRAGGGFLVCARQTRPRGVGGGHLIGHLRRAVDHRLAPDWPAESVGAGGHLKSARGGSDRCPRGPPPAEPWSPASPALIRALGRWGRGARSLRCRGL